MIKSCVRADKMYHAKNSNSINDWEKITVKVRKGKEGHYPWLCIVVAVSTSQIPSVKDYEK